MATQELIEDDLNNLSSKMNKGALDYNWTIITYKIISHEFILL